MKYIFNIEYHTNWGEEVRVLGNIEELGANELSQAIPMSTTDGINWRLEIKTRHHLNLQYRYIITYQGAMIREESLYFERGVRGEHDQVCNIFDCWLDKPLNPPSDSAAFTKVWLKPNVSVEKYADGGFMLSTFCSGINPSHVLAVLGNHSILGNWEADGAILLDADFLPQWSGSIPWSEINDVELIHYKYAILDRKTKTVIEWEQGEDRVLKCNEPQSDNITIQFDTSPIFDSFDWRGAGVAVPIFSLRTQNSFGIGEFTDVKLLAEWAKQTNQKIIQLLPVNDTTHSNTWEDSYPYRCRSVFALNPVYLNLDELGILQSEFSEEYQMERARVNQLKTVDFPYVQKKKQLYTQAIFQQKGEETLYSLDFKRFYDENKAWLVSYAIYSILRDKFGTSNTNEWERYAQYQTAFIDEFNNPQHVDYSKLQYIYFIQYHLYKQLKEASDYTTGLGVVLKGDLPIGIDLHSADAWVNTHYFHLNGQAGAPPDDFAQEGQNWGFPTYNWVEIAKDNFKWWRERLNYMSNFFQAYRIDHILGFFRIWTIPRTSIYGTLGQFVPALLLSIKQIEDFGFKFDEDLYTTPYITDKVLVDLEDDVKHLFFVKEGNKRYRLKEEFDTQAKLLNYFQTEKGRAILSSSKKKLMDLCTEVLFLEDISEKGLYHPRIDAYKTEIYQTLDAHNKQAFDTLYHDFFYLKHNEFWKNEALDKLPRLIQSSQMLVCGEDLGMIPQTVPEVMRALEILSLEIERMPKRAGVSLDNPQDYPYLSVSAFSTHDMSTLRGWWEESREQANLLYKELFGQEDNMPLKLSPEIAYEVLNRELCSPSMLSIQSLQDWMSLTDRWYKEISPVEEQINVPANIHNHWNYRMPGNLENLKSDNELNLIINKLITRSNR